MNYEVILAGETEENVRAAYHWYMQRSPIAAEQWYERLSQAIMSLEQTPSDTRLLTKTRAWAVSCGK